MSTTTTSHTIRECKRGQHFSTPTQSDGAMTRARRSGKGQTAPRYRQIRGYRLPSATVESAHSSNQGSQRLRCCSAYSCLRSTVQGRNPNASNPRKGKALKSPPIGCFSEFSRRAPFTYPIQVAPTPIGARISYGPPIRVLIVLGQHIPARSLVHDIIPSAVRAAHHVRAGVGDKNAFAIGDLLGHWRRVRHPFLRLLSAGGNGRYQDELGS